MLSFAFVSFAQYWELLSLFRYKYEKCIFTKVTSFCQKVSPSVTNTFDKGTCGKNHGEI